MQGEPVVYFQNMRRHFLHYDFVRSVLGLDLTNLEFTRQTYAGEDRFGMAGSLVRYADAVPEVAAVGGAVTAPTVVTFFPSDNLTPTQALLAHRLIEERLGFLALDGGADRLLYLPAGDTQERQLVEERERFVRAGSAWTERVELYGDVTQQLLNPGVAYGTLRRMTPEELEREVVSFRDVLVLTRLPNELPIVGGTITEELQTPLAHVNVAARGRGTPNMALLDAGNDDRVSALLGELVRFEVTRSGFTLEAATLEEAQAFWDAQGGVPFVPPADVERDGLLAFADIGFADAVAVGAKAANVAELAGLLGEQAPHGFAVPFYYYDQFLTYSRLTGGMCAEARDDCLDEERPQDVCDLAWELCVPAAGAETLAEYIDRLLADDGFQTDSALREASLDGLRYAMRHLPVEESFAAALEARIADEFGDDKVRLRSSTNAEDLEGFSGAGLYTSVSADASGGDRAGEEIRKVWASVWNWRAFEERAFWSIDHQAVKMGVLVHQRFPDEQANGVLITQSIGDPTVVGMYVNVQLGEGSVTNPEDGAIPEVFTIVPAAGGGVQVQRQRFSSLSPDAPILTDDEVTALYDAADLVVKHFAPLYGVHPFALALDLEFKFHGPARDLYIKQARPYATGGPLQ